MLINQLRKLRNINLFVSDGFCVSDTKNLRIFKDIFVQIFLPYSIRLREQAILRMALFNYNPSEPHRNVSEIC